MDASYIVQSTLNQSCFNTKRDVQRQRPFRGIWPEEDYRGRDTCRTASDLRHRQQIGDAALTAISFSSLPSSPGIRMFANVAETVR